MRVSEIDRSSTPLAEVAELVDALASGASELMLVEVQVLSSAPSQDAILYLLRFK